MQTKKVLTIIILIFSFFGWQKLIANPLDSFKPVSLDELPKEAQSLVNGKKYSGKSAIIAGTKFYVLTRMQGGIESDKIESAIIKYWPEFVSRFSVNIPSATIVDFDAPMGGGPLGDFIVGVYSSDNISKDLSTLIEKTTGWPYKETTQEYILSQWGRFDDPVQTYVDDMVIHELGHLVFGFGVTRVQKLDHKDSWFCLGLGMVYDRLIWNEYFKKRSPLFEAIETIWRKDFSNRIDIDQRLIDPNTTNDSKVNLNRLQVYGHGKSYVFLKELREQIGSEVFDSAVNKYISFLSESSDKYLNYDGFLDFLPSDSIIKVKEIESKYTVR